MDTHPRQEDIRAALLTLDMEYDLEHITNCFKKLNEYVIITCKDETSRLKSIAKFH